MSETVQLALVAALPIILTQVVTAYLAYKGRVKQEAQLTEQDIILDTIHQQTNSNLTEQKELIKALQKKINVLMEEKGAARGKAKEKRDERSRES